MPFYTLGLQNIIRVKFSKKSWYFAAFSNFSLGRFVLNLVTNFRNSGQPFINKNFHNSRITCDINMKHGPVTKLVKRNTTTYKNDDEVMQGNCDVIVIFPIYGKLLAIWKRDSRHSVILTLSLI